ncbi:O-antigen ligase family protein [Guptibacillus hwajinpoensis]|uniref:O-antigen ligase family protein n=1 Tax=Guptibacillus hwajinpoensis TaxID=208199 RepID=UPI0024B34D77|nr:O-antigen ligase family protein [Pseudalkalibacillus hwajinpoensis]
MKDMSAKTENKAFELWTALSILVYNIAILFYQYLGMILILLVGILFALFFIKLHFKKWYISQILSFLLIVYIPTSFVSILGTSYGALPITWFNLTTMILVISILLSRFKINFFFFSPLVMLIFGFFSLFKSIDITDSLKQLLTIVLFLISFFIGEFLSRYESDQYIKKLKSLYILSVFSFSIIVIIQKVFSLWGIGLGYYAVLGTGREVFAGLMNDYSFATLYVATGSIILVIDYVEKKSINILYLIILESFFLISMLVINSRTGLVAFAITAFLYLVTKIIKGSIKSIIIMALLCVILPSVLNYVVEIRGGQSFFDGSGRIGLLLEAGEIFYSHPLVGVGFGLNNLHILTGFNVPHNVFVQYLAQFGIIGSLIFFSNFVVLCYKYLKFKSNYFWVLLSILIGSMLIPCQ